MATKFYLCTTCGNVIVKAVDSGVNVICCGKQMQELVPSTDDFAVEKHLPVVEYGNDGTIKVKVGSVLHPMTTEHHISFIYLETEHGGQMRHLTTADVPEAVFNDCKDKPVAVYAYCNIHGLWKTEIKDERHSKRSCCGVWFFVMASILCLSSCAWQGL